METPLTPLEFARRTRKLYGDREAVVDGGLRLTYEQFFDRCDRWSAALQRLGVRQGDRVAYIAPNTHAMLESFYGVPQIGAVLVPINYRLSPDEFAYIVAHSGATVLCVHEDYLAVVDGIREQLPGVRHFVALEGLQGLPSRSLPSRIAASEGWTEYESLLRDSVPDFTRPTIEEADLLS